MKKVAVIGTGIAGMAAARMFRNWADITIYEQNNYVGGHTNTVFIEEGDRTVPIDSGFIVCNRENYPLLMRLFTQLEVPLKPTSMSFSAIHEADNIEYGGSNLNQLFAQRRNLFSPRYIRFLMHVNRFNAICPEVLEDDDLGNLTIAEYARHRELGNDFLKWYILPMSAALWSTPISTTVRFFKNHGLLGLNTQFQWYTVDGGSEVYKQRLIESFRTAIRLESKVVSVAETENGATVTTMDGQTEHYDEVVIATHADQALSLLTQPTDLQQALLAPFRYQVNATVLHTDASLMPERKLVWSSWNYRITRKDQQGVCTYWMNKLQGVSDRENYFVTLNGEDLISPDKVLRTFQYEHPIFTVAAMQAQHDLPLLNQQGHIFFCGSYFRNGFHEDALRSAVDLATLKAPNGIDIWS
jgi:uncharacterized protein